MTSISTSIAAGKLLKRSAGSDPQSLHRHPLPGRQARAAARRTPDPPRRGCARSPRKIFPKRLTSPAACPICPTSRTRSQSCTCRFPPQPFLPRQRSAGITRLRVPAVGDSADAVRLRNSRGRRLSRRRPLLFGPPCASHPETLHHA
jgi:hypothetical protein